MKLISFGKQSWNNLYPLTIIFVITAIKRGKASINSKMQEKYSLFCYVGVMFLGEIAGGCLYFIYHTHKKKTATQSHKIIYTKAPMPVVPSQYTHKYTWFVVLFILGLGVLDLISSLVSYSITHFIKNIIKEQSQDEQLRYIHYFVIVLLSVLILNQKVYRHHYVALGINTMGALVSVIPLMIKDQYPWESILLNIGKEAINAVIYNYDKWLMEHKRISPFFLLLLQGIIGFSLSLLLITLEYGLCPADNLWYCPDANAQILNQFDTKGVFYLLVEFVRFFIVNICMVQTIYYFSPPHLIESFAFSFLFWWVIKLCEGEEFDPLTFICYLVISLGYLMYNETIIFHFWKLDYNTRKMIEERSQGDEFVNFNYYINDDSFEVEKPDSNDDDEEVRASSF